MCEDKVRFGVQSGSDRVHEVHCIGCTPNRTPPKFPKIFAPGPRTGPHLGCGPVRFGFGAVPEPDPSIPSLSRACAILYVRHDIVTCHNCDTSTSKLCIDDACKV